MGITVTTSKTAALLFERYSNCFLAFCITNKMRRDAKKSWHNRIISPIVAVFAS